MARPRRKLSRFRAFVLGVVGVVQVPGVAALAHFFGHWPLAVGGATLISLPFLYGLKSPFEDRPKSRLYLYAGLWPFFAWWVACLVFAALARSEEHTSELQSPCNIVCRLLLEKKKKKKKK